MLHGFVSYLSRSGNLVDVFSPSTADEDYLPLNAVCNSVTIFPVRRTLTGVISSTYRYVPLASVSLSDLETTQRLIADEINKRDYDIVLCEQDRYTMTPFILRYLRKATVHFCDQPPRSDEEILRKLSGVASTKRSKVGDYVVGHYTKKMATLDRRNAAFANYVLANSYFSRESILRQYGQNAFVCHLGVDPDSLQVCSDSKRKLRSFGGHMCTVQGFRLPH